MVVVQCERAFNSDNLWSVHIELETALFWPTVNLLAYQYFLIYQYLKNCQTIIHILYSSCIPTFVQDSVYCGISTKNSCIHFCMMYSSGCWVSGTYGKYRHLNICIWKVILKEWLSHVTEDKLNRIHSPKCINNIEIKFIESFWTVISMQWVYNFSCCGQCFDNYIYIYIYSSPDWPNNCGFLTGSNKTKCESVQNSFCSGIFTYIQSIEYT